MRPKIFYLLINIFFCCVCYAQQAYNVRSPYDPATQKLEAALIQQSLLFQFVHD